MGCLAVQCAVGEIGEKALTELSPSYESLINTGNFQYGLNSDGIFLLNTGNTYSGVAFTKSFTLPKTDLEIDVNKRLRFLYIKVETYDDAVFTIKAKPDNGAWVTVTKTLTGADIRLMKIVFGSKSCIGDYITINIASTAQFRIHKITGLVIPRSASRR